MQLTVFCLPLSVHDSFSLCLCSITAKHTGGVPEESFGSLPEVGTEPCCSLFSHLHPHFPQNHCVTAQLYRLTECEKTALSLYFSQSFIFTCIICTVCHLSYAVYAVTSYHEYVLKVKFILEKSFSNTHTCDIWYFYTCYSSWRLWYSLQPRLRRVRSMFYKLIRWNGPNIHNLSHW